MIGAGAAGARRARPRVRRERAGRLVVCPTPIGNLEDVTLRVLAALRDGRRGRLRGHAPHARAARPLRGAGDARLLPRAQRARAGAGARRADASTAPSSRWSRDAGMPLVCDPGYVLVQGCVAAGLEVEVLPGAVGGARRAGGERRCRPTRGASPASCRASAAALVEAFGVAGDAGRVRVAAPRGGVAGGARGARPGAPGRGLPRADEAARGGRARDGRRAGRALRGERAARRGRARRRRGAGAAGRCRGARSTRSAGWSRRARAPRPAAGVVAELTGAPANALYTRRGRALSDLNADRLAARRCSLRCGAATDIAPHVTGSAAAARIVASRRGGSPRSRRLCTTQHRSSQHPAARAATRRRSARARRPARPSASRRVAVAVALSPRAAAHAAGRSPPPSRRSARALAAAAGRRRGAPRRSHFDRGAIRSRAGQHRGVDLAAPPRHAGARRRAPAASRSPGRVAGRRPRSSVRCGALRASTYLAARGARRRARRAGRRAGRRLGTVAAGHGGLHLGVRARRATRSATSTRCRPAARRGATRPRPVAARPRRGRRAGSAPAPRRARRPGAGRAARARRGRVGRSRAGARLAGGGPARRARAAALVAPGAAGPGSTRSPPPRAGARPAQLRRRRLRLGRAAPAAPVAPSRRRRAATAAPAPHAPARDGRPRPRRGSPAAGGDRASLAFAADGLLRHDADLLRQRGAAPRPRVHDDRRRHPRPPPSPARRGRVLPHGHRRARRAGRAGRRAARASRRRSWPTATPQRFQDADAALNVVQRLLHPHHRPAPQGARSRRSCSASTTTGTSTRACTRAGTAPRCADFKTEHEIGPDNTCPIHHIPLDCEQRGELVLPALRRSRSRSSASTRSSPTSCRRAPAYNEALAFISGGLQRRLAQPRRSSPGASTVPWDPGHVFYVWFDALLNYYTALGFARDGEDLTDTFWPATFHIIGKDILKFHAVFWPAMLMAAGIELPQHVFVHGYLLMRTPPATRQDVQVARQRARPVRGHRPLRHRRAALLLLPRGLLRPGRRRLDGDVRRALRDRARQRATATSRAARSR